MTAIRQRGDNEAEAYRRFEGRVVLFWTGLTYLTAGLGLWSLQANRPEALQGWSLVGLAALLATFFLLFHRVFRGPEFPRRGRLPSMAPPKPWSSSPCSGFTPEISSDWRSRSRSK